MEQKARVLTPPAARSRRRRITSSLVVGALAFVMALALAHGALEAATGQSAGHGRSELTVGTLAVVIAAMSAVLAVLCRHMLAARLTSERRRRANSQAEAPRRRALQTPHFFLY